MNAVEIDQAVSELFQQPFDAAEFPFQFLAAFDRNETTLKRLRTGNTNRSDVVGGVLQRNHIHIAPASEGEVDATIAALRDSARTASEKARYILATDGAMLHAEDLTSGDVLSCEWADFPNRFGIFLPLAGITAVAALKESVFDIKATRHLNKLYVELLKDNADWRERRTDMNHFMARLIFCFFAEDTDIFHPSYKFTETVQKMSAPDSSNTHEVIETLFRATARARRLTRRVGPMASPMSTASFFRAIQRSRASARWRDPICSASAASTGARSTRTFSAA